MNPSASGWIKKLYNTLQELAAFEAISEEEFFIRIRNAGFMYGANIRVWWNFDFEHIHTEEERTKLNLLLSLFYTYCQHFEGKASLKKMTEEVLHFYSLINTKKPSFLEKLMTGKKSTLQLEKVMHYRIQTNKNIFSKNFSNIITNALLFVDVLAFKAYLNGEPTPQLYIESMEKAVTSVVFNALNAKKEKTNYDELLVNLLQSSLRYHKIPENHSVTELSKLLHSYQHPWETRYILDLACLAVWNDELLDLKEEHFVWALGHELLIEESQISFSLSSVKQFIREHKDQISFFKYSNPVKHFYDQSSKTVNVLILRNKKRLLKELEESKELVRLLSKSTSKELSEEEKVKVKEQLLDVCKTVPSLAIFAVPGGSLLLPLMIKFIPKLLPSAFDDNRVD